MQLGVCERSLIPRFTVPDKSGGIASRPLQVTVQTIHRSIELPTDEPLRVRRFPIEDFVPFSNPLELTGLLRPVSFGIPSGLVVKLRRRDERRLTKLFARRKLPIFMKQSIDVCH